METAKQGLKNEHRRVQPDTSFNYTHFILATTLQTTHLQANTDKTLEKW